MNRVLCTLLTLVMLTISVPASAAVIGTYVHEYGKKKGYIDPQGADKLSGKHVTVRNDRPVADQFYDSFSFSNLAGAVIDSISFTLDYDRAGPDPSEIWRVNILGSQPGNLTSDYNAILFDDDAPRTWTLNATTDGVTNDAFSAALANLSLAFNFDQLGTGNKDDFRLYSAQIVINGTATIGVVPLPAPGLLLLGALGGLGLMRRRRNVAATV